MSRSICFGENFTLDIDFKLISVKQKDFGKMNTRKIGKKLEDFTHGTISKFDSSVKQTSNSGAGMLKGDLVSSQFKIECKKRNVENISINRKVWNKLCSEIVEGSLKTPLLIVENSFGEKWAILQLDDFARIMNEK